MTALKPSTDDSGGISNVRGEQKLGIPLPGEERTSTLTVYIHLRISAARSQKPASVSQCLHLDLKWGKINGGKYSGMVVAAITCHPPLTS